MSYDLTGCFVLDNGLYKPKWADPCGGDDIVGCMEDKGGGHYGPKVQDVGSCTPDSGCVKLDSGKYKPVLRFDSYTDLDDLKSHCCIEMGEDCSYCGEPNSTPRYISATFSGVVLCTECMTFGGESGRWFDLLNINGTFVLEQQVNPCVWQYTHTSDSPFRAYLTKPDCTGYYTQFSGPIIIVVTINGSTVHIGAKQREQEGYSFGCSSSFITCNGIYTCNNQNVGNCGEGGNIPYYYGEVSIDFG